MPGIEFILPMIASILQGGIGTALDVNQQSTAQNERLSMARARRKELMPLIEKLRQTRDYFDLDEQAIRDFSRASNQMDAQAASTGMTNAGTGGLDSNRSDLLGSVIAQLAQAKTQDQTQRTQQLIQLLSDPDLYAGMGADRNVAGDTILGGLLGGVTGAGTQLSGFLGSEWGMDVLKNLGGPQAVPLKKQAIGLGYPDPISIPSPNATAQLATPRNTNYYGGPLSPRPAL